MIGLLQSILCVLQNIALAVLWALLEGTNLIIVGLGAFMDGLGSLLPDLPASAGVFDSGVLGWLNWVVPIGTLLSGFAVVGLLWLSVLAIRAALRWAKML